MWHCDSLDYFVLLCFWKRAFCDFVERCFMNESTLLFQIWAGQSFKLTSGTKPFKFHIWQMCIFCGS